MILEDTLAIVVLSKEELDGLLKGKWSGAVARLRDGDIEGSLSHFDDSAQPLYRELFNALSFHLPSIVQEMSDIQFIDLKKNTAIYDLRTVRGGVEYSFQLIFKKDASGIWIFA